jgi:colanic acid/amylovoran biosynthesis glycosyltransferase
VKLPGAVGQDEIRRYYEDADVFVLPSFAEGVPAVLMEAMAMGLPVVTTRVAGIPELVEDGQSGFVVPPGRVDALVEAVRRLASDPELRREMGERGREKVISEYSIDPSAAQLRDMFASVLG